MLPPAQASASVVALAPKIIASLVGGSADLVIGSRVAGRHTQFRSKHPTIDLVLDPTLRLVDLAAGEADLAIRYGDGKWSGCAVELLMSEELAPVVSPAFAERAGITDPIDMLDHLWLHARSNVDWNVWVEAAGIDGTRAQHLALTDYNMCCRRRLMVKGLPWADCDKSLRRSIMAR